MRRTLSWFLLTLFGAFMLLSVLPVTAQAATGKVYVLRVDQGQMIDQGLAQIMERGFTEAEMDPSAVAVAIVIDTPGGLIVSAMDIKTMIMNSKLPTVAYVEGDAFSSGALIATASQYLYMHSGSSIGAAEARVMGTDETADYKTMSAWISAFESAARDRGRDPKVARAMVDRSAKIPGQEKELLVLTANEAVSTRYANGYAADLADALKQAGIQYQQIHEVTPTMSESVGRILTTPWVAILLLVVGVIAIGIEFIKPGVTVPGLVGVVSLTLFFLGNVLVGTAGWLELGLAVLGVVLLVIEAFVPGFGVFGIGGVITVAASIFLSVPTPKMAVTYLMWTSFAFAVALFGILRAVSRRGLGKALTLKVRETNWVPERADLARLIGMEGRTLSVLRPAGSAFFGHDRVDVVTEGEFLPAGTRVKVIRVDGARVVVRSVE